MKDVLNQVKDLLIVRRVCLRFIHKAKLAARDCVHVTYALFWSFLTHPPPLYTPSTPLANPPSKVRTMSADPPHNWH